MIRDAYSMGADEGVILSDRKFAGSDVLATSYTLSQGIEMLGGADLILCGRQTTDGDTAQIGPAIAEHLHIPHCAWVSAIEEADEEQITLKQDFGSVTQISRMHYPCLVTVDKDICVPRLPSWRLSKETKDRPVRVVTFDDLPRPDLTRFCAVGSPTRLDASLRRRQGQPVWYWRERQQKRQTSWQSCWQSENISDRRKRL